MVVDFIIRYGTPNQDGEIITLQAARWLASDLLVKLRSIELCGVNYDVTGVQFQPDKHAPGCGNLVINANRG